MKKIMKILLHIGAGIMLSVFIYRYGEAADSHLAEMTEVEKDVLPNRSNNDEVWNMTEDAENVIGEIEILEKSMYVEEEIASMDGWIVTKYLKYPYFTGGSKKVTDRINEQIFQTVMHENMAVEDWVTYIEMTYEITFEDEQYLSILLEGNVSRGGGYGEYSRGMNFDMESGELLSMEDICEWILIQEAVKKAVEKDNLSVQVGSRDIWLDGEQKEEYLKTDFMDLFKENSYLRTDKNRFFIRDGYLVFIAPSLPSFKGDTYIELEIALYCPEHFFVI